ncbi:MAG: DUF2089 domain-containing protein [Spirochaetales bacterium]|jgi:hypothetical protein|nr:DUF2089 domain-containing protein [Spirochaetales bacterium]
MTYTVSRCPACGESEFNQEKIRCAACGTAVEGSFRASKLGSLPMEQQDFIEVFIRCRGNIKDVERVLGISYPTVRSRLDRVIRALGYETENTSNKKKEILESLARNEISTKEALGALKESTNE